MESDLISRQAAIDAIYENEFSNWCDKDEVSTILNDLPSVDVVRCKDCKHNSLKRMSGNTYCDLGMGLSQLYDFCSLGERRTDETD